MFLNLMLAPVYITEYLWAEMLFTKIIWTYKIVAATKKDRNNGVVRFIFPQELWCLESCNIQSDKKPIENVISHCGIMIYVKYPTSTVVKNNL